VVDWLDRLNYVLWIQDIMRFHDFVLQDDVRTIHGIDMYVLYFRGVNEANLLCLCCSGTGASAIYPLLACKMEPSWKFIATGDILTIPHSLTLIA